MDCQLRAVVVRAVDPVVALGVEPAGVARRHGRPCGRTGRTRGTGRARSGPRCPCCSAPTSHRRRRWCRPRRCSWPPACGRGPAGRAGSCGWRRRRSPRPTAAGAGGPTGHAPARTTSRRRRCATARAARCRPRRRRRSCGSAVICQMRASAAPVSSGKVIAAPSGRSCQVAPRSSECITVGPQCSDRNPAEQPDPARRRGTKPRLGTSRMRNCGPSTDQSCRSSLRASHSPLRVPTATTVLVMAGVWPQAPTVRNDVDGKWSGAALSLR